MKADFSASLMPSVSPTPHAARGGVGRLLAEAPQALHRFGRHDRLLIRLAVR
jgi:hypothetical protein